MPNLSQVIRVHSHHLPEFDPQVSSKAQSQGSQALTKLDPTKLLPTPVLSQYLPHFKEEQEVGRGLAVCC